MSAQQVEGRCEPPSRQWTDHAACFGHQNVMLLPERRGTISTRHQAALDRQIAAAKQICRRCPVQRPCRDWALSSPEPAVDHVAGGLSPRERDAIRKRRRAA